MYLNSRVFIALCIKTIRLKPILFLNKTPAKAGGYSILNIKHEQNLK